MRSAIAHACVPSSFAVLVFPVEAQAQSRGQLQIYGFVQGDYTYDGNRVDPAWDDALRPTKIPTTPGTFGSNGQSSFSAKQSRFGVSGDVPINQTMGSMKFKFEFDMFGVGVDAGQTTIRLRHAYGEFHHILAGQLETPFMDLDVFPNILDYWGPNGMIFFRNVMVRYRPIEKANGTMLQIA